MGKSIHFIGQPMYSQVIKLLDKSKILQISQEQGGEHYTKRFTAWIHLVVMLYAIIKRFDSLREITTSLLADTNKLSHLGITFCHFGFVIRSCRVSGSVTRKNLRGYKPRPQFLWIVNPKERKKNNKERLENKYKPTA